MGAGGRRWQHGDLVGGKRDDFEDLFANVDLVARFECKWCRPDENHKPIYVAHGMKRTFEEIWRKHHDFE